MSATIHSELRAGAIDILQLLKKVKSSHKGGWSAICPAHNDTHASLSVARASDRWLVRCHVGCTAAEITAAIGLDVADLFDPRDDKKAYAKIVHSAKSKPEPKPESEPKIVAQYEYQTADGKPYLLVQKTSDKQFLQARWIEGEGWYPGAPHPKIPYRLPELLASDTIVHITEGEKDCDRLASFGLTATSASEGAGHWASSLNQYFKARDIVIVGDNDQKGRDHARQVATSLTGIASRIRIVDLPGLKEKQDVSDWLDNPSNSIEAFHEIVAATLDETQREWVSPLGEWNAGDDDEPPPPRAWLLGNIFCREFASSILGPGAVGKTALRYVQYLSLAAGRSLTGDHVFARARVLIISLEDGPKELRRRIKAARLHHEIAAADLDGWLFLSAPRATVGKLLEIDKQGNATASLLASAIKEIVVRRRVDLVAIDPFVKAHGVQENDNTLIDIAMQVLTDLANEHNLAVDVPHHIRKGGSDPGNADTGRGASSQKDAGRLVYTLSPMSPDEAKAMGVSEQERRSLIRMDSAKVNICPPLTGARWFRLVGVRLDNATEIYPHGDEVQTVEPWTPPDLWEGLSSVLLNEILTEIDAGMPDGDRYSDAPNAKTRAAWKVSQARARKDRRPSPADHQPLGEKRRAVWGGLREPDGAENRHRPAPRSHQEAVMKVCAFNQFLNAHQTRKPSARLLTGALGKNPKAFWCAFGFSAKAHQTRNKRTIRRFSQHARGGKNRTCASFESRRMTRHLRLTRRHEKDRATSLPGAAPSFNLDRVSVCRSSTTGTPIQRNSPDLHLSACAMPMAARSMSSLTIPTFWRGEYGPQQLHQHEFVH